MTQPYYQDEHVTLYHGDCLEITEWLTADVLVTDPPYGMNLRHESRFTHCSGCGRPSRSRYGTCRDCRRTVAPSEAPVAAVVGDKDAAVRDAALRSWGHERPAVCFGTWKVDRPQDVLAVAIWDKGSFTPPGNLSIPWASSHEEIYILGRWAKGSTPRGHGVIRVQALVPGQKDRPDHPTPKPVALMESLIAKCPPGAIADPFAGSGSTLVAAKALGRKAIGVELEERYAEIAARRLAQDVLDFGGEAS